LVPSVQPWLVGESPSIVGDVTSKVHDPPKNVADTIITTLGTLALPQQCDAPSSTCNRVVGAANHANWPSGLPDGANDWEPSMLAFLAAAVP
jgi:hypothetical protein